MKEPTRQEKIARALVRLAGEHGVPNNFYMWEISQNGGGWRIALAGCLMRRDPVVVAALEAAGYTYSYEPRSGDEPARVSIDPVEPRS